MEQTLLNVFENYQGYAVFISIILSIIVAVLGVVPSFFITVANVSFFGFFNGFLISLLGEAIGAIISFFLYRKGFKKISQDLLKKNEKVYKIINKEGKEAFILILAYRLFPYMPSGFVTYASAVGKVDAITFTVASTIGKVPSMLLEVLSTVVVIHSIKAGYINIILTILSIGIVIYMVIRRRKR